MSEPQLKPQNEDEKHSEDDKSQTEPLLFKNNGIELDSKHKNRQDLINHYKPGSTISSFLEPQVLPKVIDIKILWKIQDKEYKYWIVRVHRQWKIDNH